MNSEFVNHAEYVYKLFAHASVSLANISLIKPHSVGDQESLGILGDILIEWIASTLNSPDAFLLSWPEENGEMRIYPPKTITTEALVNQDTVDSFEQLAEWLGNDTESWACNDTSDYDALSRVGIQSCLMIKMVTKESEGFGLQRKELLAVCNRDHPRGYLSYDLLFLRIANLILQLHFSEIYNLSSTRYQEAHERYQDSTTLGALGARGDAAADLLLFYSRYRVDPPLELLYECLDSFIALYSVQEKTRNELLRILDKCETTWLSAIDETAGTFRDAVRCALARGYFALGIKEEKFWRKGSELLSAVGSGE